MIQCGGESICFYPGWPNASLVSRFLVVPSAEELPSTIKNELIISGLDQQQAYTLPILSYQQIELASLSSLPATFQLAIEDYLEQRGLTKEFNYQIWHLTMPYGGPTVEQIDNLTEIWSGLANIIFALERLSELGYILNDLHLGNICTGNGLCSSNVLYRLIDYGNFSRPTKIKVAYERNFLALIEALDISEKHARQARPWLKRLLKIYDRAENKTNLQAIYQEFLALVNELG